MAALEYSANFADPATLQSALNSYPELASAAAWAAAELRDLPPTDIVITVYDNLYKPIGVIGDYISLEAEFKRNEMGVATIVVKDTDPIVPLVTQCTTTVVPITIQVSPTLRWSGRVNSYADALSEEDQEYTVTLECIDDFAWLSRILVWPNPALPLVAQIPSHYVVIGPVITCILTMIAEQALRLQSGLWAFLNNITSGAFDPPEWVGNFLLSNGNPVDMLLVPIVVQNINPFDDTSAWVSLNGRMDKISSLLRTVLMDYGISLTCSLWLPGDEQPPNMFVPLTQPCIYVSAVDRSGVTGPAAGFIDGLIEDVVDLQNSLWGTTLSPLLNPNNEYYPANLGINIAPALGINFVPSWVIFNGDVEDNGLISFKLTGYHPLAHTVIGGGKSPVWMDDLINATLEFLMNMMETTIGFTGVPDSLFDGTFDDLIFAFQELENFARRMQLGVYGFPEYFTHTGASAYTIDEWFALMQAMYDTEGYNCIQLSFLNGIGPYAIGKQIFLGGLVSFARRGQLYTDYVYQFKVRDTREKRAKVDVIVGNGKREVNPILRVVRMITGLEAFVNVITLSN